MKSKFLGLIVTLAVVLGLMLVPAVPVVAATGDCGIAIDPSAQNVGLNTPFEVNVTFDNPDRVDLKGIMCHINFTASLVKVISIDYGLDPFNYTIVAPDWNNTEGWLDYDGSCPIGAGIITNVSSGVFLTIHMKSKGSSGIADIEFVPVDEYLDLETAIKDEGLGDHLNWTTMVVNGNVTIGTPELTVNVTGEGDVDIDGNVPPGYPNVTEWGWYPTQADVPLTAEAALGWAFVNWTGDFIGSPTALTTTVRMDALTKSVTAHFVELPCELNVTPDSITCSVREGPNEGTATPKVTVTNAGGGTLRWQVGYPPIWNVSDTWTYWNTYDEAPPTVPFPNPYYNGTICPVNNTVLTLTVINETNCTYTAVADWPLGDPQRTINATDVWPGAYIPCCLQDAVVVVDKCNLDYISQVANLTVYLPGQPAMVGQAFVTWVYDGCHGWPYYLYKTWNYNVTIVDDVHPAGKTTAAHAMVTAGPVASPVGPETDCYVITHYLVTPASPFMQQYWSDTARNFVYQWDGGTFNAPPLDQRILQSKSIAGLDPPACCNATVCNLSFDKMSCNLGAGESADINVTCNVTGLDEGTYNGSFCITGCCCQGVTHECVNITCTVLPPTFVDTFRTIMVSANSGKPGETSELYAGETFDVYVNFTAPANVFNAIGLTDVAPDGWTVTVNKDWNSADGSPISSSKQIVNAVGNKAEIMLFGPYNVSTQFELMYQVTVPTTAEPGENTWPLCGHADEADAWLEYYFDEDGPYPACITKDWNVTVTQPGDVVGETREVNSAPLADVDVTLYRLTAGVSLNNYGGDGVAEWSTDQAKSGDYSVKLGAGTCDGSNAGKVMVEVDPIAIADFTGVSYWVWEPAGIVHGGQFTTPDFPYGDPYINIFLDTNNDGVADDYMEGIESYTKSYVDEHGSAPLGVTHTGPTPNTWVEMAEGYGFYDSNDSWGSGMTIYNAQNLSEWQAWFAANTTGVTVVAVGVYFGFWLDDPLEAVYVDDITISGTTYDLESSTIALKGDSDISTPDYIDTAYVLGEYSLVADRARFYAVDISDGDMLPAIDFTIDLSTPDLLAAGNVTDFEGDYGLIPKAPTLSYALKCVNLWKVPPADEWDVFNVTIINSFALSEWKVMDVCSAWLNPS